MPQKQKHFSLGFNFDSALIDGVIAANAEYKGISKIEEVFGALPDSPISSARPTLRIPNISWAEFTQQTKRLRDSNIQFNFLMNTNHSIESLSVKDIKDYLKRLADVGIQRLTVGTPELCLFIREIFSSFHITISITYGTRSISKLLEAEEAGADAVYLDGVYVNRDFELLRYLLTATKLECRLYANLSCIAACPVVSNHYGIFMGKQSSSTTRKNDAFFAGCTLIKLNNPVEWLQMPWIRPEDISVYISEGINHFKLADRLAPTKTLLTIAKSYLSGESPDNLFVLMERDGAKYKIISEDKVNNLAPIYVKSQCLPLNFIDHYRSGACKSNDVNCSICAEIALKVIKVSDSWQYKPVPIEIRSSIPSKLIKRGKIRF